MSKDKSMLNDSEATENLEIQGELEEHDDGFSVNVSEQRQIRREKLAKLRAMGRDPFLHEKWDVEAYSKDIIENYEAMEGKTFTMAGRIMAKRNMGKASFIDIQDGKGRIQCYVRQEAIGEEEYEIFLTYDIGDIIGFTGEVFKTRHGEISIRIDDLTLLSKSLTPLPDKWGGLKDQDLRYRQRYVDLIVNPEVREVFKKRTGIIHEIKRVLEEDYDYIEVDTPILTTIAGGANARPFSTHHNTLDIEMKLRISNELYLKRLTVGGMDRVYEMGKMFRNEGMDRNHNPEYTSMECYMAYEDMDMVMEVTENLVSKAAQKVNGSMVITYDGKSFDLTPPWRRLDMAEAVKIITGVDFAAIDTDEEAQEAARAAGLSEDLIEGASRGLLIAEMFDEFCENEPGFLDGPIFITGHPVEISPLSKRDPEDPRITRRFEAYINGWEIANAFSELNDPIDQYNRFKEQQAQLDSGEDDEAHPMDEDFVNALEVGLPPTGGLGVGIDRVVMLITDAPSIRDVILFPTMKPIEAQVSANKATEQESAPVGAEAPKQEDTSEAAATPEQAATVPAGIDLSKLNIEPLFEDEVDFETFSKSDFRVVKVLNCEDVPKSNKLLKFVLDDGSGTDRVILSGIKEYYKAGDLIGKTLVAITNLPERKMMGIPSQGMLISAVYEYDGKEGLNLLMLDDNIPAGAKLY